MNLNDAERRMLDGEYGALTAKYMKLLVAIGEAYDAPKMLKASSAHIAAVALGSLREAGKILLKEISEYKCKFKAFTTINPLATDLDQAGALYIPEYQIKQQEDVVENLRKAGALLCNTCTPYLIGNIPNFGQHIAWGETSAVLFVNSYIGARTNAEGGPSALASAITGVTPYYGLHLDENRYGEVVVHLDVELQEPAEYAALALYAAKEKPFNMPVFENTNKHLGWDGLKMMSAIIHSFNSSKMFHVVGVTPEATTIERALGGKKAIDTIHFNKVDLENTIKDLNTSRKDVVEWIAIGCPHCSINEIRDMAQRLEGKQINSNVMFWVLTNRPVKAMADRMGYTKIFTDAGVKTACDTCPVVFTKETIQRMGIDTITTNSPELAHVMGNVHGIKSHFGRLSTCIDAALTGIWRL